MDPHSSSPQRNHPATLRFREPSNSSLISAEIKDDNDSIYTTSTTNTTSNDQNQQQQYGSSHHQPFYQSSSSALTSDYAPPQSLFIDPEVNSSSSSPQITLRTPYQAEDSQRLNAVSGLGGKPLTRGGLTLNRTKKTIRLSPTGNFVIKSRVPEEVLAGAQLTTDEEVSTMRYTGVTCDPNDFQAKGYTLRPISLYKRTTELFIVVTMYNEDVNAFNRTMFALAQNIKYLCTSTSNSNSNFTKAGWGQHNSWQKVVVCIVADGRSKVHPDVLKALSLMGVYQDGLAQSSINNEAIEGHVYEYTAQTFLDEKLNTWGSKDGMVPMQIIFCLKERNLKKINSHRWFFNAFAPLLNPRVCALIDVGTKPSKQSLYYLWEAFFRNEQIAGACGEIRADMGRGLTYFKNLLNPLVASQVSLQYHT
jgi:chitin synthase